MTKAFISHSTDNSSGVVGVIDKKLRGKTLKMDTFLSTRLPHGTDFVEEVIKNLAEADVLLFVIDAESHHSEWMKWEHEFCRARDIPTIYIKFSSAKWDNPMLDYINHYSLRIDYTENDMLCNDIHGAIENLSAKRAWPAQMIAPVQIDLDSDALHGEPGKSITVSGSIHMNNQDHGSAYLHVPTADPGMPPTSMKTNGFRIGADGRFVCEMKLPNDPAPAFGRTWYAEIRLDRAAIVVPIRITTQGGPSPRTTPPPDDAAPAPAPAAGIADGVPDSMRRYSDGVLAAIPRTVGCIEYPRPEAKEAASLLDHTDRIVLTGDKGSGKSVVLCQLYRELAGKRRALLVRCDDLLQSKSVNDLDEILGGGTTVSGSLGCAPGAPKTVILFDSLDAASRDAGAMLLFRRFIQSLWATGNVQTVCSVREYDYEHSPSINTVEWGRRLRIGDLPESALEDVLGRVKNHTVPAELKKILRNPLRLKIFHMIARDNPTANFANVKTEIQLYQEHWNEYVDRQDRRDAVARTLLGVAGRMIKSRRVAVPRHALGAFRDGLDDACDRGILAVLGENVRFFHHAYLDYVASKHILQHGPGIAGFLDSNRHNVFLLPTLTFTLSLIHDASRSEYLKAIMSICNSSLPYYWKTAAIRSLAALDGLAADDIDPIGRMLSDNADLLRHFLLEAGQAANPFWLRAWLGTRMKEWSGQTHNAMILLEYIGSLSDHADLHEKIIDIARTIVDNDGNHPIIRQRAVMGVADMSFASKATWCVGLSLHPEAHVRSGVLHCLESLLDLDEDSATTVFANVASRREASSDATPAISHGSFNMTSNKMQDNLLAVWEAGEMFPALLEKNPTAMIRAAVRTLELANDPLLDGDNIVEDRSGAWMGGQASHAYNKILESIKHNLPDLLAKNAPEFIGLLASSRLAVFHRLLLAALLKRPEQFKDEIYRELLAPSVLSLPSTRDSAREAIRIASPLLSGPQTKALLGRIMGVGAGGTGTGIAAYLRPHYLSAFDRSALSTEQRELADTWEPSPLLDDLVAARQQAATAAARPAAGACRDMPATPEQAADLLLEDGAAGPARDAALDILERLVERTGDDSVALDGKAAAQMRSLFLRLAGSPDPQKNEPDAGIGAPVIVYPNARGLAARGLIRMCARTMDESLLPEIESLSRDGINAVRGGVAEDLERLYDVDADLARRIALRYSGDADRQVLVYLPRTIFLLARNYPDDAVRAIEKILLTPGAADDMPEPISHALLYLALAKGARPAGDLLQKVLDDESLPTEIRRCIPFTLKEGYLFPPGTQDGALEIFSRLLDSGEPTVRESAAFFLLASAGDDGPDSAAALIRKMGPHLDKIAAEAGADHPNQKTIEALVEFIEDHWHRMPARALAILESISRMPSAPYQPVYAGKTIAALNGLFRTLPGEDDQNRCLSMLDVYVRAGWPDAMDLLAKMGRPD